MTHDGCTVQLHLPLHHALAGPGTDVAVDFLRSPLAFIDSLTQQYGPTVGLKLGGEHVVLTGDPDISRQVLIDQATVFVKVSPWLSPHLSHGSRAPRGTCHVEAHDPRCHTASLTIQALEWLP